MTDESDQKKVDTEKLKGLSFCTSGVFHLVDRKYIESVIQEHQGKVHLTIHTKTNYLITGSVLEDGRKIQDGKKYRKARQLGTTILSERDFEQFLKKRLQDDAFTLGNRVVGDNEDIVKDSSSNLWVEKYKPKRIEDLVGNQV